MHATASWIGPRRIKNDCNLIKKDWVERLGQNRGKRWNKWEQGEDTSVERALGMEKKQIREN